MKFSYPLIKKFIPKLKSKTQAVEALSMHSFEAEEIPGNTFEVNLPPNRYSDSSSHWGIAKELAAIFGWSVDFFGNSEPKRLDFRVKTSKLKVEVEEKKLCSRYTACFVENISMTTSPRWIQEALINCGLRPINGVVDVMNYVMLEIGQPLHAFDADKLNEGKIIIRRAKKGESMTTIDGVKYDLTPDVLVIADGVKPVAIAGIKGGQGPEVSEKTKHIIIEAATFDSVTIYKTSKSLKLVTDASQRFSHALSEDLAVIGLSRAAFLLEELFGAKIIGQFDSRMKPLPKHVLKFDVKKFNAFIGSSITEEEGATYLKRLGFSLVGKGEWEAPLVRTDIETHEDVAEEVARLFGYSALKSKAPHVSLQSGEQDEMVIAKGKTRRILSGMGADEVYTSSFVGNAIGEFLGTSQMVELENPMSTETKYLRPTLVQGLLSCAKQNQKFYEIIKCFEVGKIFIRTGKGITEQTSLGIVFSAKQREVFFELKGFFSEFLKGMGLVQFDAIPRTKKKALFNGEKFLDENFLLEFRSDETPFAYLGTPKENEKGWHTAIVEINLDLLLSFIEEEDEFEPLPKFPSVMRDISCLVPFSTRVGECVEAMQNINMKWIRDVDLIDEYVDPKWNDLQSLTFRIVFQSNEKTFTTEEIDREMKKVTGMLEKQFNANLR